MKKKWVDLGPDEKHITVRGTSILDHGGQILMSIGDVIEIDGDGWQVVEMDSDYNQFTNAVDYTTKFILRRCAALTDEVLWGMMPVAPVVPHTGPRDAGHTRALLKISAALRKERDGLSAGNSLHVSVYRRDWMLHGDQIENFIRNHGYGVSVVGGKCHEYVDLILFSATLIDHEEDGR